VTVKTVPAVCTPAAAGRHQPDRATIDLKTLPASLDSLVNPIYRITPQHPAAGNRFPSDWFLCPTRRMPRLRIHRRRRARRQSGRHARSTLALYSGTSGYGTRKLDRQGFRLDLYRACRRRGRRRLAGRSASGSAPIQTEKDPALRTVLYHDTPVDDIARDRLGFGPMVHALRRFLDNPDTAPPVVLSVNGPWNSGKSSVMKMLSREMEKTGRFCIVWFSAWQYHHEEQILAALRFVRILFLAFFAGKAVTEFSLQSGRRATIRTTKR
jgi:hypothetical protein